VLLGGNDRIGRSSPIQRASARQDNAKVCAIKLHCRGEKIPNSNLQEGEISVRRKAARVPPIRAATRDRRIFMPLPQAERLCVTAVTWALISINPGQGAAWQPSRLRPAPLVAPS